MIDPKKLYRTRDGREVRIYAVDGGDTYPVHGAVLCKGDDEPDYWEVNTWSEDGSFDHMTTMGRELDLIEVRPRIKREVWVNVYPSEGGYNDQAHRSREDADNCACQRRIACVKLTIDCEEGEGL